MSDAQSTQQIDHDGARVTQWRFATAGVATGVHTHEFDYIVVPVTGGELEVVADDGTTTRMTQVAGVSYSGLAGTRHNVVSAGAEPIVFVEVELTLS
jgi:quercetin dioxygenase-like cupin family protein